ncbi:electron transfer flavoprotein subunit alpha [Clostridium gasigenes]|uniref:Electron transfer flavoprotein alpha subunit apoprotein n=1 Tax=Clostridium gasigenes TaxID=94869 RepID=A0A1H0VXS2_9CLOT|nr:electron transfer flavoprotein subunit alpha [Clostridium gasigenes]MBB6714939.1 electron transfer flavoprotein subunit alpha [Clostridium gasigenes]MBU3090229.1 electron transfer flavoprotein subunit alpha [Clostridium gasigenes]SDP83244.1 electron transfer flavoprotein alpha subunit apoprotein [Clostridium gasigenes]
MGKLIVNKEKINSENINELIKICPFGAIEKINDTVQVSAACKMCKLCVKKGPSGVMEFIEEEKPKINKDLWTGVAVYVDHVNGEIHPVTYELIGKAIELAKVIDHKVYAVFIGYDIKEKAEELLHYGVDEVIVYDEYELRDFRIEPYTAAFENFINIYKPSSILVGATTIGRSLAPRVAARFRTGLTADCTILDMKKNTDLIQIRPAFGGNIMAQIVNPNHRPQLATVRYKVMDAPVRNENKCGEITLRSISSEKLKSNIDVLKIIKKEMEASIADAEIIVAIGRGVKSEKDMDLVREIAERLGAHLAGTRPMVENGWIDAKYQIGLSGRTVKPKLIFAIGISGAVQFTAGMNNSECIIAINNDPNAQIFDVAHYGLVGDLYEILPMLMSNIKNNNQVVYC